MLNNILNLFFPFAFGMMISYGVTVLTIKKAVLSKSEVGVAWTEIICGVAGMVFCILKTFA